MCQSFFCSKSPDYPRHRYAVPLPMGAEFSRVLNSPPGAGWREATGRVGSPPEWGSAAQPEGVIMPAVLYHEYTRIPPPSAFAKATAGQATSWSPSPWGRNLLKCFSDCNGCITHTIRKSPFVIVPCGYMY